jgi:hypothetical protein
VNIMSSGIHDPIRRAEAESQATRDRQVALTMRKAVDEFRLHSADRQPHHEAAQFAATTLDHACIAWLLARGFTVTAVTP